MRNNQDRLGVEPSNNLQPAVDPIPEVPVTSQAMQFVVPTELVDLPSRGLFYDEGHPLHNVSTVEIRHMTTKEEDILTNQSFIKNGSVIDRLLQSVLVTPGVKVGDLLVGDKNALTVACRMYGYGEEYETKYTCPSCSTNQEHVFNLAEITHTNFADNAQEYDAEIDYSRGTIVLPIPRTKTRLELKILKDDSTFKSKGKTKKQSRFSIAAHYEKIIVSVNGNSDRQYVRSYINSMSALDSRYLRSVYSKIVPGIDFACTFECSSCDYESEVEVPLTAEFFWPKS
ncbi:MAG: putative baseplate hub assembly protein [Prokaryotic dsDNA virus sp.]|nr:MAG: putative baseplate hub assembly protein [Prokaryotic dsDNA virus sp.]|tara:strand:- start:31413 stop:32267 length:855 start_codon:yes stop_codon:yes gene_type:complete